MDQQAGKERHQPGSWQAALTDPDRPAGHQSEDRQRQQEGGEAAGRASEEQLLQRDERNEGEQQREVGRDGNEKLQPG